MALENLEHRGATGADSKSGDGAGILMQMPDAFFREEVDFELPPAGTYGVAMCFLPTNPARAREDRGAARAERPRRGPGGPGLARRAARRGARRSTANRTRPCMRQLFVGARRRVRHRPGRVRAQALRDPPHLRARVGPGLLRLRRSPRARSSTRGCSSPDQVRGFFPDLQDPRFASAMCARALPLLDEHVPELGARPPVPRHRPQRRDQHADGQRQLDARPRVRARVASCSAATSRRSCRSCAPAARTRRRSTTCSSCSCWPGAPCRTR